METREGEGVEEVKDGTGTKDVQISCGGVEAKVAPPTPC